VTRVLITGAGGFIGSHLVADQLRRGREVTAVDLHTDRLQPLADNARLRIVTADFTDGAHIDSLLPGHEICFHLASAHLETGVDDSHFWRVNVDGTGDFVARCHRAGVGRFVHCSSVGVYGDIQNPPADEESERRPNIPYEQSKLAGEEAVMAYAAANDYAVTVLRPAWVYGPDCARTEKLFRSIRKGRFFFVGDGRTLRHPIYIEDMVNAFESAAGHERALGQAFIIAGPSAVSLRELADEIARALEVKPPRLRAPLWLVFPAVYLLELAGKLSGKNVPFTRRSLKFFTGNTAFAIGKAREELGFTPQIELAEGIGRTAVWLKQEGRL
jgi:nucleoside-diphosphate-sugar epimerase